MWYLIQFVLHMSDKTNTNSFRYVLWLIFLLALMLPLAASQAAPPFQQVTPTETFMDTPTATLEGTPLLTPSLTATLSGTLLITVTPGVAGPTPPTLTPFAGLTPTPTASIVPTATDTLEPLPEITLLFPVFTPTHTATPTPEPTVLAATQAALAGENRQPLPPEVQWVGFVIILLWLLLAGFLILFIRHFGR